MRALYLLCSIVAIGMLSPIVPQAEAGTFRLSFRNHRSRLSRQENQKMNQYIKMGCKIFQFSGSQTKFIQRATQHVFRVFNNRQFQTMIRRSRFSFTRHSGPQVMSNIARKNLHVTVWGYRATRSCRVGRHANAFHIYRMIYINRDYLQGLMRSGNWRRLAHTLAHEMMHDLGYGHGKNEGQGSLAKKRSVPIKVGCLVGQWGTRANLARACH